MNRKILSLCGQSRREMVKKVMTNARFKVSFISLLSEASNAINDIKPVLFIHDWQAQDESQARQFHLKFGQSIQAIDLGRIILVPEVTPQYLAFASDSLVEKFHSYSAVPLTLATEAQMLIDSRETSELQKFLRESKVSGVPYNQR